MLEKNATMTVIVLSVFAILAFAFFSTIGVADPEGVTPSLVSNSTRNSTTPGNRSDPGGYIYTLTIDSTQQNPRWKGYVGNITGRFTLEDSDGYAIYDWDITTAVTGEVYATRNTSISWATMGCADSNEMGNESQGLGFSTAASDNIQNTFNTTTHQAIIVAGNTITASTCPAIATFVNDTRQTVSENAYFQEVLFADSSNKVVYTSVIEDDAISYKNDTANSTYDFQLILADVDGSSSTLYYFYVELG